MSNSQRIFSKSALTPKDLEILEYRLKHADENQKKEYELRYILPCMQGIGKVEDCKANQIKEYFLAYVKNKGPLFYFAPPNRYKRFKLNANWCNDNLSTELYYNAALDLLFWWCFYLRNLNFTKYSCNQYKRKLYKDFLLSITNIELENQEYIKPRNKVSVYHQDITNWYLTKCINNIK
jgi:hypothetical protein